MVRSKDETTTNVSIFRGMVILGLLAISGLGCVFDVRAAENSQQIGMVLMHGKGGDTRWVNPLASSLRSAGLQVVTPDMSWHERRIYDSTFEDSLVEIHQEVQTLKAKGVSRVFVAGHSLGAIAAAGYGAAYDDVSGIIVIAPGHFVESPGFQKSVGDGVKKAAQMIKEGKGDKKDYFPDVNEGKPFTRRTTAKIYYSWFAPDGPAKFVTGLSKMKKDVPVLYITGEMDGGIAGPKHKEYAFDKIPEHPGNRFFTIPSRHLDVPRQSAQIIIDWLSGF